MKLKYYLQSAIAFGAIFYLLYFVASSLITHGSKQKSRQIGEASQICSEKGGMLIISDKEKNSLILDCVNLKATIELPADCMKAPQELKVESL